MNIESLTPACKLDRYEMKYVLCENKFTYNTPYILFNSLCTQSKSYFGHIKNSNSKRESVNIYHVTLTLLKVQFLSCVLLKC